ncbi:MAG: hypothetical protein Tsb0013_22750 [Phycisphaerales bacterium]
MLGPGSSPLALPRHAGEGTLENILVRVASSTCTSIPIVGCTRTIRAFRRSWAVIGIRPCYPDAGGDYTPRLWHVES